jgi:hypothetical protein
MSFHLWPNWLYSTVLSKTFLRVRHTSKRQPCLRKVLRVQRSLLQRHRSRTVNRTKSLSNSSVLFVVRQASVQPSTELGQRFRSHCTSETVVSQFSQCVISPLSPDQRYKEYCDSETGCSGRVSSIPRSTFVEWYDALSMQRWTRQENYASFPLETV